MPAKVERKGNKAKPIKKVLRQDKDKIKTELRQDKFTVSKKAEDACL